MPAPKRNRYAAKPRKERHSEAEYIGLRMADKRLIREAAGGTGVADWARRVSLSAAQSTFGDGEQWTVFRCGATRSLQRHLRWNTPGAGKRRDRAGAPMALVLSPAPRRGVRVRRGVGRRVGEITAVLDGQ